MIEETARHAGHLDIARELTDHRTGLGQRYQEHRPPEMRTVFPPHTDRPFRPAPAGSHLSAPREAQGRLRACLNVTLTVEPAKDWPEPDIPEDFQTALGGASDISELWKSITPMARWEWVRWINAAKNLQTRERRVEAGISKVRSGKRRSCCFDLAACTDPNLSKNGILVEVM